ncbi:MAG: hypothetical protein OXB88_00775, partial [Bacteriovoracales bacterium]|nr:hypothetical protein [Bacteriovoracales bacterium]
TARTSSKNCNKGKVTVLHPDKIGRRQRGATEACFLHVAGKRRGSRLPRLPGGEQLQKLTEPFRIGPYSSSSDSGLEGKKRTVNVPSPLPRS